MESEETSTLSAEIAAYETMRSKLEMDHNGEWVVIYAGAISGYFESMEDAAHHAVETHGRGPYLIRQVGAPPITLPTSVIYQSWQPVHAPSD